MELKLYLFGPPRVERNGQQVEIPLRKALALFAYLADTRQSYSRDLLATLFWPDKNQQIARANLRRTIHALRQLLDEHLFEASAEQITLRTDAPIWLDVEQFQQQLAAANLPSLIEAADLYTADFMAGFTLPDCPEFDDWQFFRREELRGSFATLLEQVVSTYEADQKWEEALRYARRWLALDPLEEATHRRLLQLYAQVGQLGAALRQYEECVRILAEELDALPNEETTALYQAIRTRRLPSPNKSSDTETQEATTQASRSAAPIPAPLAQPLPAQTTPFVGRRQELAELLYRLAEPDCRLLTLVGSGGIGKTRLALAAAQTILELASSPGQEQPTLNRQTLQFQGGVFFVPLQPVSTVSGIVPAIAAALGFQFYSGAPLQEQLLGFLRTKQLLLILDNMEHLLAGADLIVELLAGAPGLKLLVTSREALKLAEEWFHPLGGMRLPPSSLIHAGTAPDAPIEKLSAFGAVQLFIQTARRTVVNFQPEQHQEQIVRICRLVDGMPLGIILAASWLKVLSCAQIAQEIERGIDILVARHQNIPERHRNMRVVLEQSWQLLDDEAQRVLKQLAVFRGGFRYEAAAVVAGAKMPTLADLVDTAWVYRSPDERYHMHELLRQFAQQQLASRADEERATCTRHSDYYLRFLSAQSSLLVGRARQIALAEIAQEIENVRVAHCQATQQENLDALHEAVEPLYHFYQIQSRYQEGKDLFVQTWEQLRPLSGRNERSAATSTLIRILARCGAFCHFLCEYDVAERYLEECLALIQRMGDQAELAFVFNFLGQLAVWKGDQALAQRYLLDSLSISQANGDQSGAASALEKLANLTHATFGEYARSKLLATQSLALSRELDHPDRIAYALDTLGFVTFCLGEYADAERCYRESLSLFEMIGDQYGAAMAQGGIALVLWAMPGDKQAEAIDYFEKSLRTCRAIGHQGQVAGRLAGLARIANDQGEYEKAQQLAHEGLILAREVGSPVYLSHILYSLGQAAYETGALPSARNYLMEALQLSAETGLLANLAIALFHYAALLIKESAQQPGQAINKQTTALELLQLVQNHPATWHIYKTRAATRLAELAAQLPPDVVASAQTQAERYTLQEVVARLLGKVSALPSSIASA